MAIERRMISIAAAVGWNARFRDERDDSVRTVNLAAWGLVEVEGGQTQLVGIVQRSSGDSPGLLVPADEVPGFDGYVFTGLTTKPT
jgi:hypothetical protein